MKKFVADGRKLSNWSVWTALETYLQVRHLPELPPSNEEHGDDRCHHLLHLLSCSYRKSLAGKPSRRFLLATMR